MVVGKDKKKQFDILKKLDVYKRQRYEDKIGFIECKVPVPVFCRFGKSPETHVITLSRHLSRRDNCQHVMKQA